MQAQNFRSQLLCCYRGTVSGILLWEPHIIDATMCVVQLGSCTEIADMFCGSFKP